MQIESVPIESLIPYARNARTHSEEQVAQIAGSIREFGFTNPVLIDGDGGFIIHGKIVHSRTVGSRGWKQSVEWIQRNIDPKCRKAETYKHRYLMPLDAEMRERIAPLAQPYPKRVKKQDSERPSELGGAVPTDTLQNAAVNTEE